MLKIADLQEALRRILWERIEAGEMTGVSLAEKTGFRQAHISNFLNRKRGLSVDGMDRILGVEGLSVLDLVPSGEINQRASIPPPPEEHYANVLLVAPEHADRPQLHARDVLEVLKFKQSFLTRMRPLATPEREAWLRFLMIKPSRESCEAMYPRLSPRCTVLLDRHYNRLTPYRRGERTMYAVRTARDVLVRYAHLDDQDDVILQAESSSADSRRLRLPQDAAPEEFILCRVAYISMEA